MMNRKLQSTFSEGGSGSRFAVWLLGGVGLALVLLLPACTGRGDVPEAPVSGRGLEVVYLSPVEAPELWHVPVDGAPAAGWTETSGQVADYCVSRDGAWIVYPLPNTAGGQDLWLLETGAGRSERLLDCGAETCTEASWAPDGERLAFTRAGKSPQTIWMMNRRTGQAVQLIADGNVPGRAPSWSPDGRRIAFIETRTNKIRIVDLEGGEHVLLPSTLGEMGSWSPDGGRMVYLDRQADELFAGVDIYVVDLVTQKIQPFNLPGFSKVEIGVPVWHPREDLWLLSLRPLAGTYSKQLWLVPLEKGLDPQAVTSDHNFAHAAYAWSPEGEQVVYQRYELETPGAVPEVWVWERATNQAHLVAENAALPRWLPPLP